MKSKGKFKTQALLCTDQDYSPIQILEWFVRRWQVEVTFEEVRAHLGVETQRQWSDAGESEYNAIIIWVVFRALLSLHIIYKLIFICLVRQTSWYSKHLPSFSDALALSEAIFMG